MKNKIHLYKVMLSLVATILLLYSCASIGRPDGGPIDEDPPEFIGSTPKMHATNITKNKITLHFDEFIKLENVSEKVVVSPPQIKQPLIKPLGKRVSITLEDTLQANTTYTIDFGDAIVDNNEGNALGDFTFTFSTGDQIDTLAMSGVVLAGKDLEPIKNILVGLHKNLADSAFTDIPFIRVARTDAKGQYTVHGIAPGKYRIYALQDMDQNYVFSQKSERIAFSDSIYIPTIEERIKQDTIWKDTMTIDTVYNRKYTHYLPDDIILRAFEENFYNQYLVKYERAIENKLTLYFSEYPKEQPKLTGLNFDATSLISDYTHPVDTIYNYWIKDSLVYQQDTLLVQLDYQHTDTLNQLVAKTDTLRFMFRHKQVDLKKKKKDKKEEEEVVQHLKIAANIPSNLDDYDYLSFAFDEPIQSYDSAKVHLKHKKDTIWESISDYEFEQDSINIKRYNLYHNWTPGATYKLQLDSLAFNNIYNVYSNTFEQEFKVKKLDEYGTVIFNVSGYDPIIHAFIELLDTSDKVVRTLDVDFKSKNAAFYYLNPGKYGARIIIDRNNNGKWDTGDFATNIQPEEVYYYPQFIELKANWTINQDWDVSETPLPKQKLNELKKQKPDDEKKNKKTSRRR